MATSNSSDDDNFATTVVVALVMNSMVLNMVLTIPTDPAVASWEV